MSWLTAIPVNGQNLVPNHSFETFTTCPAGVGLMGPTEAPPWDSFEGSTDYFNVCGTPAYRGVPTNFQGYQVPKTGDGYMGAYFRVENNTNREFARAELTETLEAGVCYKVGCWINLCNKCCATNKLGLLLSTVPIANPVGMIPQVNPGGGFFSDTVNWVFISDYVIANGGERYITIGNFYSDLQSPLDPACNQNPKYAYYYYDDVIVEKASNDPILPTLGNDVTVCDSYVLNPGLDPSMHEYSWSTGSTDPLIVVNSSGVYSVTITRGCLEEVDTVNVTVQDALPVSLGEATDTLCPGETVTIQLDENAGNYLWQDGTTQNEYTITGPGTYSVTLDDGCDISTDVIEILEHEPAPVFTLGVDTFLCPGDAIQIIFSQDLGTFAWQDGNEDNIYTITTAGTYSLTITNSCGDAFDELSVVEIVPPVFTLGEDISGLCDGEETTFSFDPSLGDFVWQDGSSDPEYTAATAGIYSVTVTNECGSLSDEVLIEMNGTTPTIDLGPDITLCEGDEFILDATPDVNTTVVWQDGSSDPTYNVTVAGNYSVDATNLCGSASDEISISYKSPPSEFSLGPDTTFCPGETLVLVSPDPANENIWQDGSALDQYQINSPGSYSLQIQNECGSQQDTLIVTIENESVSVDLGEDLTWCLGDTFFLDAIQPIPVTYKWNTNATSPAIEVVRPGLYAVEIISRCATSNDSILVLPGTDCPEGVYYIPNIFSPNGDGVNDVFTIGFNTDLILTSLSGNIFDRWGNQVFSSSSIPFMWNGGFEEKTLLPGVYVYVVDINYTVSGITYTERLTGNITLVL